nr:MAG TPA: D12 class N6 adenine-specific DNA methyltransferase [Caudoviricetes sp.]
MIYMGSKRRIAEQILTIILEGRRDGQYYVETFCGGCNMIDKVQGNRIANDRNPYLIAMWEKELRVSVNPDIDKQAIEKLFIHKSQL